MGRVAQRQEQQEAEGGQPDPDEVDRAARMDQSQIRYPVKMEAQTGFGTLRGKTLSFRERPLTPEESQAMRR